MRMCSDLEKHKDVNNATDKEKDQEDSRNEFLELWKSPKVIVYEDDGEYD